LLCYIFMHEFESDSSSNYRVSAAGIYHESHHFLERSNIDFCDRLGAFKSAPDWLRRVEQQEPDVVVPCPSLQKHKHSKPSAFDGLHIREFNYNNPCICLRGHGFAQFGSGFALHKAALALNDRQFPYVLNRYI
jgi:hypothetical protein